MPKLDTETRTGVGEKIGLGFMVGVGIIVVGSFLAAAAFVGWNRFTAAVPTASPTSPSVTANDNADGNASVEGAQTDRDFYTD